MFCFVSQAHCTGQGDSCLSHDAAQSVSWLKLSVLLCFCLILLRWFGDVSGDPRFEWDGEYKTSGGPENAYVRKDRLRLSVLGYRTQNPPRTKMNFARVQGRVAELVQGLSCPEAQMKTRTVCFV